MKPRKLANKSPERLKELEEFVGNNEFWSEFLNASEHLFNLMLLNDEEIANLSMERAKKSLAKMMDK